ncbi:MAG: AMP-binding protein, partial [Caldilineaceae bacterium]|nr:AMP-binding protein [Caldilineaceae bacterium]
MSNQANFSKDVCIHHLFEAQAEQTPQAIALIFQGQQVTYGELNERANQLAHHLQNGGVGPEVLVGLCVERSVEMVVGLLAILKAGGAYIPLDPTYPQERLAFMLEDAQVSFLLTQTHLKDNFPTIPKTICLDADWPVIARLSTQAPTVKLAPDNLAYVIYTSGSTGKPKGVLVPHQGLCNVSEAQIRLFHLTPQDNILQFASFSFDAATFEIVMALRVGATLCLGTTTELSPG